MASQACEDSCSARVQQAESNHSAPNASQCDGIRQAYEAWESVRAKQNSELGLYNVKLMDRLEALVLQTVVVATAKLLRTYATAAASTT